MLSPSPPNGSSISINRTDDTIVYEWVASSRHPMQWIPAFFGAFMVLGAITAPIALLTERDPSMRPTPLEAFTFSAILICSGLTFLYAGLKRRGHEQLVLTKTTLKYDTGPTPLPLPFMLIFGQMFALNAAFLGNSGAPVPVVRKRFEFPICGLGPFVLERVGERQRIRVDHGVERVEIGYLLREPEREWLAIQVQEWQAASGSVKTKSN